MESYLYITVKVELPVVNTAIQRNIDCIIMI